MVPTFDAEDEAEAGQAAYEAFVAMLDKCHALGGKDAMHVVTAAACGCTAFISRDSDFTEVQDLIVYRHFLPAAS
jgi:predicted nucleic acid-binding protein